MANQEHLSILKSGIKNWNEWRELNPDIKPNLSGATLIRENLKNGIFSDVDFSNSNLRKANLSNADLSRSNLHGVDLTKAICENVKFIQADLKDAIALGTRFTNSDFTEALIPISILENDVDKYVGKQEHVEILQKGAKLWNEWRELNPNVKPDLREIEVSGLNLSNLNMRDADLRGADMTRCTIINADFSGANLVNSEMVGINIQHTNLHGVTLTNSDLSYSHIMNSSFVGSVINNVDMTLTNIRNTTFQESDFNNSIFAETLLSNCVLKNSSGLDGAIHLMPSIVDHRTLMSSGDLPLGFLRGVGLPNNIIEYFLSLENKGSDYYSCFISYSSTDEEFARKIYDDLQENGVRCWFAPEDMQGGKKLYSQINRAINLHDKLLLILSKESMESEWVMNEINATRKKEESSGFKMFFPICIVPFERLNEWNMIDSVTGRNLANEVRSYFIPDFSDWENQISYDRSFETLIKSLKQD